MLEFCNIAALNISGQFQANTCSGVQVIYPYVNMLKWLLLQSKKLNYKKQKMQQKNFETNFKDEKSLFGL